MDLKTSVLINRQVPEFVREDHPLFIDFLEAYYEFLETKQGVQLNDLLSESKQALYNFDVDQSISEFESHFFNTFAPYINNDMFSDKAFFIKNVLNLYQAKGTEKSVQFLFKLLFGKNAEVIYPKNNILIASDGKWIKDNILNIDRRVSTFYTGDGTTTEFKFLNCRCPMTDTPTYRTLVVYVDDVLQTEGVDYLVLQEYHLIIFTTPIPSGSSLEIFYETFDPNIFINRKFIGTASGASVISEKIYSRFLNNEIIYEIYVDPKTLIGEFQLGEEIITTVFVDEVLVNVKCQTISSLKTINIVDSGAYYNVGDPVIIKAPDSTVNPSAIIHKTFRGQINDIFITEGGAGFGANSYVYVVSDGNKIGLPLVNITVSSVFGSEYITANSFTIFSDIIGDIDPANTTIDATDYGLNGFYSGNANTIIAQALGNTAYTDIGQVVSVDITAVDVALTTQPILDVEPAKVILSNNTVYIDVFGSLGKLSITSPGENYVVGDELIFTNRPNAWGGVGAEAEITQVGSGGEIERVNFVPSKISGTANTTANSVVIIGTDTFFDTELYPGCQIMINGESKIVDVINSNVAMNVTTNFVSTSESKPVRLYGKYLLGGQGYRQEYLPSITIDSATGSNGSVEVTTIMGDGESLIPEFIETNKFGGIDEILIIDYGSGIKSQPIIDLSDYGDGTATATATLIHSYVVQPGRWKNSDGRVSFKDIKLQNDRFYHNRSYVISSEIEFTKYRKMLLDLLHPAGTICYGKVNRISEVDTQIVIDIESEITTIDR